MNNKAESNPGNQIMLLLIMGVVLIGIIVLFFLWQLFAPPLVTSIQSGNDILNQVIQESGDTNLINAQDSSFDSASDSLNNLEWLSYTIFILFFFTFIMMCFYVRTYPFLVGIWIVIVVLVFIGSLWLTVVYQEMATDTSLGYASWENTDFMLRNLPAIIFVVGLASGIIMYIIASKDKDIEAGSGLPI